MDLFSQEKLKTKLIYAKENLAHGSKTNLTIRNSDTLKIEKILHNLFRLTNSDQTILFSTSFNKEEEDKLLLKEFYSISFRKIHSLVYYDICFNDS